MEAYCSEIGLRGRNSVEKASNVRSRVFWRGAPRTKEVIDFLTCFLRIFLIS
jgi:hypothetical protein